MKRKWIGACIAVILCLITIVFGFLQFSNRTAPISEAQEDTFSMKVNKETVKKDKTFILNVAVASSQDMQAVEAQITYDPTIVEFLPTNKVNKTVVGTEGILTLKDTFTAPTKEVNYQITFKALSIGTCDFLLSNANYSAYSDLSIITKGDSTESISIIENPGEDDDSTLSELLVGQGDFVEPWDSDIFDYTIIVPKDTKELTYSATPSSKDAIVQSQGPKVLSKEDHVYTITVTAPSGSQSVYTITVLFEKNETEPATQVDLDSNPDNDLIDIK